MFGIRTPVSKATGSRSQRISTSPTSPTESKNPSPVLIKPSRVRRSIGEWEAGKQHDPQQKAAYVKPSDPTPTTRSTAIAETTYSVSPSRCTRVSEAKSCLTKVKLNLSNSRNIKTEIKERVAAATERLYQLVKESEEERKNGKKEEGKGQKQKTGNGAESKMTQTPLDIIKGQEEISQLLSSLAEHSRLVQESNVRIESLKNAMQKHEEAWGKTTYAKVAAGITEQQPAVPKVLHSVVITSKDDQETGEEVLNKVREAVDATKGWLKVERVRKAKDRKIIISCKTKEERAKLKEKLKNETAFSVEEIQNKNPLVVFRDVFNLITDEVLVKALSNQNTDVVEGIKMEEELEVKYTRKARNPHQRHVVARVTPRLWSRLTRAGVVSIDLQKVRVVDQSPLVQCSTCLEYGHSRRFCTGTSLTCSHCGGPHIKANCSAFRAGETPKCSNCASAKLDRVDHNSFDINCPVRQRWDSLARSTIAYC